MCGFIHFAHGVEHEIGSGAKDSMLSRGRAVDEFVDAGIVPHAALKDVNDRFIAEKCAAFGVRDFSSVEEEQRVGIPGVDVERASLVRVPEHLHDPRKIVMAKATAEAGVSLRKHLGGLKAFGFADDDIANVSGDHGGGTARSPIVVYTRRAGPPHDTC